MTGPKILVVGYGNRDRGEDAAGLLVAERVSQETSGHVCASGLSGDAVCLLDWWHFCDLAIVVDAVDTGHLPGTVHKLKGKDVVTSAADVLTTTHGLGLREAFLLSEISGRVPKQLIFYGIEARRFGLGEAISDEVQEAIELAVRAILADCERAGR